MTQSQEELIAQHLEQQRIHNDEPIIEDEEDDDDDDEEDDDDVEGIIHC